MNESFFWEKKSLQEMSVQEWESLCDGCAKCCVHKLEDDETQEVFYTNVACDYLNTKTCRCKDYSARKKWVPECVSLRPDDIKAFSWLPSSCAYRLIFEGKSLPSWHPLITGSRSAMHAQGHSVRNKVIPESFVHPDAFESHIVRWIQ